MIEHTPERARASRAASLLGDRSVPGGLLGIVIMALVTAVSGPVAAQEMDVSAYRALLGAAMMAHGQLEEATDANRDDRLAVALARDTELIEWLDAFLPTSDFAALAEADRNVLLQSRDRIEFLRATALIEALQCEQARDSLQTLLASPNVDAELRPRLVGQYDEAVDCVGRQASAAAEVPAPALTATSQTAEAPADEEVLVELAEPSASKSPRWHEWTLWGAGVAGIATGLGLFLNARGLERDLDAARGTPGLNEQATQDNIDQRQTLAIVLGGIGLVSAVVGTVLYLTRGADEQGPVGLSSRNLRIEVGTGVRLGITF